MCFTIEIHLSRKAIENRFSVDTSSLHDFDFHYFYKAFSNPLIPVVSQDEPDRVRLMEWGLIPFWASNREKADKIRRGTYNARSESIHRKPSFREPFRRGRCFVIAGGFFEWQHTGERKIPWYIRLRDDSPLAFAGLYDSWEDPDSKEMHHTCTIITTSANPLMAKIHNSQKRMPVIFAAQKESFEWIEQDVSPGRANQLLLPLDERLLHAHTVSGKISSPDTDPSDPEIVRPFDHPSFGALF